MDRVGFPRRLQSPRRAVDKDRALEHPCFGDKQTKTKGSGKETVSRGGHAMSPVPTLDLMQ